jgi:hypothetical protein
MNIVNKILILLFFTSIHAYSQNDLLILSNPDTLKTGNSLETILFQLDEFEFYRDLTELRRDFIINSETSRLWLEASLNNSNKSFFNKEDYTPGYLHSTLYDQYLEDSKLNPLRTILGTVQVGAVAYLAYRHIKKWGKK